MLSIGVSLLIGLVLSWFGFDSVFIESMKEVFNLTVTHSTYYMMFGFLGMVKWLITTRNMFEKKGKGE